MVFHNIGKAISGSTVKKNLNASKKLSEHPPTLYSHTYSKSIDQPGKVANPARDQLNRKKNICLSVFAPENLVSRDGFGSLVPRYLYVCMYVWSHILLLWQKYGSTG